jgi:hypothetical protein
VLEEALVELALQKDFSLEDAFMLFDRLDCGFLTLADFLETASLLGDTPLKHEVMLEFCWRLVGLLQHRDGHAVVEALRQR